jgi:hypothetical protein
MTKERAMTNETTVHFVERTNGPERLVCEAEVHFGAAAGPMAGFKLVGFSLWRSGDGELYVSLPARPFGGGGERRYFDLLRSIEGQSADAKRLKTWILDEFKGRGMPILAAHKVAYS